MFEAAPHSVTVKVVVAELPALSMDVTVITCGRPEGILLLVVMTPALEIM